MRARARGLRKRACARCVARTPSFWWESCNRQNSTRSKFQQGTLCSLLRGCRPSARFHHGRDDPMTARAPGAQPSPQNPARHPILEPRRQPPPPWLVRPRAQISFQRRPARAASNQGGRDVSTRRIEHARRVRARPSNALARRPVGCARAHRLHSTFPRLTAAGLSVGLRAVAARGRLPTARDDAGVTNPVTASRRARPGQARDSRPALAGVALRP